MSGGERRGGGGAGMGGRCGSGTSLTMLEDTPLSLSGSIYTRFKYHNYIPKKILVCVIVESMSIIPQRRR